MLKTTILFIGLLTEVSHLNPELTQIELTEVAKHMREEPEFVNNTEIVNFINEELDSVTKALLHCKQVAYQIGLRPGGV